jgi:ribosomal protein S18 acetylase RimI-like enzyme
MFDFVIIENSEHSDLAVLSAGLLADTARKGVNARHVEPINILHYDEGGKAVAGISSHIVWGWLYIDRLHVDESLRRHGIGGALVKAAEEMAISRKCHHAKVETANYQSPQFYESLGYSEIARLPDHPIGHDFIIMTKQLVPSG